MCVITYTNYSLIFSKKTLASLLIKYFLTMYYNGIIKQYANGEYYDNKPINNITIVYKDNCISHFGQFSLILIFQVS